jgi:hypothetical protein
LTNSAPDISIVYIVNNDHTNIEGGVMRVGSTGRSVGGRRDLFGAANPASRTASMRLCAESLWLAREEMRWAWSAYMWSVLIVLSLGLAAAVSLSLGVSEFEAMVLRGHGTEEFYGAFFVDYLFLLVCAVIGTNALLGYYTRNWLGTSSSRLVLLGKLPLSAGILVGSRMVSMLFALVVGAFAFFVPVFFVSGLAEDLGVKAYLVFCAVWVGYGLLGSGLSLFFEFGVSGRSYVPPLLPFRTLPHDPGGASGNDGVRGPRREGGPDGARWPRDAPRRPLYPGRVRGFTVAVWRHGPPLADEGPV